LLLLRRLPILWALFAFVLTPVLAVRAATAGPSLAGTAAPLGSSAPAARKILILGDSLSAAYGIRQEDSWVALLDRRLAAKGYGYRVVNASLTGDTTSGGLRRLPRALKVHRPAVLVIELGGNDGLRATPIKVMRSNLEAMVKLAQAAGVRVVLVGMQIPGNYGADYTRAFAASYPELARKYRLALVPFMLDGVALDPTLFLPDGIHPTAAAQPRLLQNIWPALQSQLDSPRPRALPPATGSAGKATSAGSR
jgi:acyl-CoA thioesterase I